jgi:hypothetical protein
MSDVIMYTHGQIILVPEEKLEIYDPFPGPKKEEKKEEPRQTE